jgi:hypothetical protein
MYLSKDQDSSYYHVSLKVLAESNNIPHLSPVPLPYVVFILLINHILLLVLQYAVIL